LEVVGLADSEPVVEAPVLVAVEAREVIVEAPVVFSPSELVEVKVETQAEALLAASEPTDSAPETIEVTWLSTAVAMEAASPVRVDRAALPPVSKAWPMEVASAAASEPMDSPALLAEVAIPSAWETMESTSMSGVAMAAVARKRAEAMAVNFILEVVEGR
jgi:hypothetical protein